ncbi:MAG: hypothetical protein ACYSUI_13535, partial [Planctomycetota bacterium]
GWRYTNDGVPIGINNAARVNAATVLVTLASTPAGVGGLSYAYGSNPFPTGPDLAAVLRDNTPGLNFPLFALSNLVEVPAPPTTGITPQLAMWWFPKADALDTPSLVGLDTREVNGNLGFTLDFTSDVVAFNAENSYYDSAGVQQFLTGPADDNVPKWDHDPGGSNVSWGLRTNRSQEEFPTKTNPAGAGVNWPWFNSAQGMMYVDFYYQVPDNGLGNPYLFAIQHGGSTAQFLIDRVVAGGGPGTSYFSAVLNTGANQIRRLTQLQTVNGETGTRRTRLAFGWQDNTDATSFARLYCCQWEDADGTIEVDLGAGLGVPLLIGSLTEDHDTSGEIGSAVLFAGPGDVTRSADINHFEARYYDEYISENFLRDLACGLISETEQPVSGNVYQMVV